MVNFHGRLHKTLAPLVLPAVYDDVLSYEEWLSKVVAQINALTDFINETLNDIGDIVDERAQENLAEVNNRISALSAVVEQNKKDIENTIDDLETDTDDKINTVKNELKSYIVTELTVINEKINSVYNETVKYTDNKITLYQRDMLKLFTDMKLDVSGRLAVMDEKIEHIIKEFPFIHNPSSGYAENVQTSIIKSFNALRYYGIMALIYDDQQYTAEEYDKMNITALEYDTNFYKRIEKTLREMFNPFTGKHENIKNVVETIAELLKYNAKTATEYDAFNYTAENFDNSDFNAYTQDTNKYYNTVTPDLKNKYYRNFLLIAQDFNGISNVEFTKKDASEFSIEIDGNLYSFSIVDGATYTIGITDIETSIRNDKVVITFSSDKVKSVYAITYIKDVSELDR